MENSFKTPPDSSRAYTWYHRINGQVSDEGATKDLEAMKSVGLGGFQVFDVGLWYPQGQVTYNSPAWHESIAHIRKEADRIGLDMGIMNGSGWSSSGGPWITPEHSMKTIIWREARLTDADTPPFTIERPELNEKQREFNFYRDICVIAFSTPVAEQAGEEPCRLDNWEAKALVNNKSDKNSDHLYLPDGSDAPESSTITHTGVIDISECINEEGKLDWQKPPGDWTVIRFGYTTTARHNNPAIEGGIGLECDKLSREAVDLHWESLIEPVIKNAAGSKAFTNILIDSFEVGLQNWTAGFETFFKEYNGYEITQFLPCLTGRIVDSTEISERFLWDFRTSVVNLFHTNYFSYFKERCNAHGLQFACETYGNGSFYSPAASLIPDIPMTEFWQKEEDRALWNWATHVVCSAAHLGGKSIAGGEAFTCMCGNWETHPYTMKAQGDRVFCRGMNRIYFHTFVHQPWHDDVKPGMTMNAFGITINRNTTWYHKVPDWFEYLARCQHISQSGTYLADILVLYGDDRGLNNIHGLEDRLDQERIPGFNVDIGSPTIIESLEVDAQGQIRVRRNGELLPTRYKMLIMKRASLLRTELVAKLGAMAAQGARIVAVRPVRSPSLRDYPLTDSVFTEQVSRYWDDGPILCPARVPELLLDIGKDVDGPDSFDFAHYRLDSGDYYFVTNTSEQPLSADFAFRIEGILPELWDPETGEICQAPNWEAQGNGYTKVSLDLSALGSLFVVFRSATTERGRIAPSVIKEEMLDLSSDWLVTFDPKWGPEEAVSFSDLTPWNESTIDDIKYYSGSAIYTKEFTFDSVPAERRVFLDLGDVQVIANITLNGTKLRTLWKPDYQVEIADGITQGTNTLEVEVTNLWPNRLIGDARYPEHGELTGKYYGTAFPEWLLAGKPPPPGPRRTFAAYKG